MQRTTIDFGIDLGTTNSSIAVIDETDARIIPNKGGSGITPSAVWIDKRGSIRVGQEAKLRALGEEADQANADLEFKLRMGTGAEGAKVFAHSGREMLPEELSAEVLKSLKMDVQSNLGEELRAAVVTVPAAFENPQSNATRKAAELAGFSDSPLLLEPVAASLAYGFQTESENVYWFVYDFGGGTFDAAVMRIRDGLIQVVDHDGDNFLGGKLIDWDLVTKKLAPAIIGEFALPAFHRGNPRWATTFGKLKYYAEQAKIEVCRSRAPSEIWIEGLCEDQDGKAVDFSYTLTPEDVSEISLPFIEQSLNLSRKTLERTGLDGSKMERILMVGGTTLNPWVRERVQTDLGSQVEYGVDPVTVVARGAAIFASMQPLPAAQSAPVPAGTWRIEVEHKPVGNIEDPDIGGRVVARDGQSTVNFTLEFVDTKTRWRSGRVTLDLEGVFMTQLYAEKQRRHEYAIELCDATGSRVPTVPERVSYTLGVIPEENPPAAMSIGIGLADGGVATYVRKGDKLPCRKALDHVTTVALRASNAEDLLRIPLLEGEHARAERNHGIGALSIRGTDLRRDLPLGSQIEITLLMDVSQQLRLQAYVNVLDEDFEISFDPQMKHGSLAELREELGRQMERLASAREKAASTDAEEARSALAQMENQQMAEHAESLLGAAGSDPDAIAELDRRLRDLAAALDGVEDAVEWPLLVEQAEKSRQEAETIIDDYGEFGDRNRLHALEKEIQQTIDTRDPELMRRYITELDSLYVDVLERQPAFHAARLEWLAEQVQSMRDPARAEDLIALGRRAISNNNLDTLKTANRQLLSLLPRDVQEQARHANIGGTVLQA